MNFGAFIGKNPVYGKPVPYKQQELDKLTGKVPDDLIDFFKTFGRCSFADGLLSTVHPYEINSSALFKEWGFKKGDRYIFLKTCFGVCIYYHKGRYWYLDPMLSQYLKMGSNTNILINNILISDLFKADVFNYKIYKRRKRL